MTEPLWRRRRAHRRRQSDALLPAGRPDGAEAADMAALYRWSIAEPEAFWRALWDFAGIIGEGPGKVGIENPGRMPGAHFFPEARLNFAENLLRRRDDADAVVFWGEDKVKRRLSHRQLYDLVSRLAQAMRRAGVGPGDRVAGFVPNMPETHRRHAGDRQPRRHLVLLLAGFRRAGRARPLRPDRAQAAVHRRRLLLRRQELRFPGPHRPNACPSCPASSASIVLPYLSERAGSGGHCPRRCGWRISSPPTTPGDDRLRARCPSTIRSTSCTPRARRACRNASSMAPAARCSSI